MSLIYQSKKISNGLLVGKINNPLLKKYSIIQNPENTIIIGSERSGKTNFLIGQILNFDGNSIVYESGNSSQISFLLKTIKYKSKDIVEYDFQEEIFDNLRENQDYLNMINDNNIQLDKIFSFLDNEIKEEIINKIHILGTSVKFLFSLENRNKIILIKNKDYLNDNISYKILSFYVHNLFFEIFKDTKNPKKTMFAFDKFKHFAQYNTNNLPQRDFLSKINKNLNEIKNLNGFYLIDLERAKGLDDINLNINFINHFLVLHYGVYDNMVYLCRKKQILTNFDIEETGEGKLVFINKQKNEFKVVNCYKYYEDEQYRINKKSLAGGTILA